MEYGYSLFPNNVNNISFTFIVIVSPDELNADLVKGYIAKQKKQEPYIKLT